MKFWNLPMWHQEVNARSEVSASRNGNLANFCRPPGFNKVATLGVGGHVEMACKLKCGIVESGDHIYRSNSMTLGFDGLDQINIKTLHMIIPTMNLTGSEMPEISHNGKLALMTMNTVAKTLARRLMTPFFCQSVIWAPILGWLSNQLWKRSELLAKHPAANRKNGVDGSNGMTIPIAPMIVKKKPRIK